MNTLIKYKRKLNELAEMSWEEKKTTGFIYKTLLPLKPIHHGFGRQKTGLLYKIGEGTKSILLRADIDALQTQNGPKHTCGHSTHTAALLSATKILFVKERELSQQNKSIYVLFQPSEENYPSGAKACIEEVPQLTKSISAAFAAHVAPLLPLGTIGLKKGPLWARGDYMEIEVVGQTVHIKDAPQGKDALEAAAKIILAVKDIQKKYAGEIRINIGVIQGGLQANTVANNAILKGDIRLKTDIQQSKIKQQLQENIIAIEKKTGTKITLTYFNGYPVMANNPHLTTEMGKYFLQQGGWKIATDNSLFSFGCEDFCFFSEKVHSMMALIGTGDTHDIHEVDCTISDKGTHAVYRYFSELIDWWVSLTFT